MARAIPRTSRLLGALLAGLIAGSGAWWITRTSVPAPPAIDELGAMDPEVAALLRELRAAVLSEPREAGTWGRFAMGCEANGFVGAARGAYDAAARLAPGDAKWAYRLAIVASRLGEQDAAMAALSRATELAPEYGPAWSRRGTWLLDRGDPDGAEAAFVRAVTSAGGDASGSIGLARVHLQRGDAPRAVDVLERLIERHPGDPHAMQLLGDAYRRVGRVDEAAFALAAGAAGEPAWHDPWSDEVAAYRRGFAALLRTATAEAMAGRFERALPILEDLRKRAPADAALAGHTAGVLTAAGRPREAIELLTSVMDEGTMTADGHLALAAAHLAAGDHPSADAHADRAIALESPGARAFELKGLTAWRSGRPAHAAALFERGLARDPRALQLRAWIGHIDLDAGRAREALARFTETLDRNPFQVEALAGLALAQLALGRTAEAEAALRRAERVAPSHPRVRAARARLRDASRR